MKLKTKLLLIIVFFVMCFNIYGKNKENNKNNEINATKILDFDKEWKNNYNTFIPNSKLIQKLKNKIKKNLKIEVYLALWCGDSRNNVPEFIKILNLSKRNANVKFYLCDRKKDNKIEYFVKNKKVRRVPTFIFYRDDKEIGRITENPKKSLLKDFINILDK